MSDTPAVAVMPTSISSRFNPLTIPEIIAMIGQLIPLTHRATYTDPFNPTRTTTTFIFAPRDLLACTAVSRAWRRVLLPILWRSYDSALMRYVPLAALQINSVHFQSFRDQFGHHHPGPFYSTNLRRLIISQQHSWTVPFMLSNPGLQHLTWTGLGHPFLDREYSALMKLANLRDLCLSNWNLIGRQLALVLCASPQLSRLSLSSIDGVQDLEGMSTLYALEEISLGFVPLNSLCLLDLVRFCPSLRRISFLGTWIPEQERDLMTLSKRMRVCCPDLCSIQFTAAYCFGTDMFNTLEDPEYAAMAQSAQNLNRFAMEIPCLGPMLTSSLISQFESLVAVNLCIRRRIQHHHPHDGGGIDGGGNGTGAGAGAGAGTGIGSFDCTQHSDIVNTARILSTCSRLQVFRLSSAEDVIETDAVLGLFATPWACLGLEVLSLDQISLVAGWKQDRQNSMVDTFEGDGWYVQSKANMSLASVARKATTATDLAALAHLGMTTSGTTVPNELDAVLWTFGSEFRKKLLPQIGLLTALREFRLNKVPYVRDTIV
ncbi:hypothetical protein BGZ54_004658 [Gamsiella multidivaricata]|nr:hypothetical protein BGZ54_004658 [Gamsiella multidivaricata]